MVDFTQKVRTFSRCSMIQVLKNTLLVLQNRAFQQKTPSESVIFALALCEILTAVSIIPKIQQLPWQPGQLSTPLLKYQS